MNGKLTFSISTILALTLVVAVLLAFGMTWQVVLAVFLVLAVVIASEFLLRNLPVRIRELQNQNCFRADGTRSEHRTATENREQLALRSNVRTVVGIYLIPFTALLFVEFSGHAFYLLLATVFWLILGFIAVRSGYLYYLDRFVFDLKRRNQQYKLRDLNLIIRNEEAAARARNITVSRDDSTGIGGVNSELA